MILILEKVGCDNFLSFIIWIYRINFVSLLQNVRIDIEETICHLVIRHAGYDHVCPTPYSL